MIITGLFQMIMGGLFSDNTQGQNGQGIIASKPSNITSNNPYPLFYFK